MKNSAYNPKRYVRLFLTGFSMGAADLVPGVSGGTIAFISGIYEELIHSIKLVTGPVIKLLLSGKIKEAFSIIPFRFLVSVGLGIGVALFGLANLLSYLLEHQPVFIWSFFFGLVLSSVFIVLKRVVKWGALDAVAFLLSAIGAYFLVGMVPVETPANLPFFFLSGAIAIIAMILPGISGSFILLLMGKYGQILNAVTERNLVTLIVFASGAVVGIALFSRVLSWLFSKYHDISIAILAGFMLGSLRKIWPWKEVVATRINSHGVEVPLVDRNVIPAIGGELLFALILMSIGVVLIVYMERIQVTKSHLGDVENKHFVKKHKASLKDQ